MRGKKEKKEIENARKKKLNSREIAKTLIIFVLFVIVAY